MGWPGKAPYWKEADSWGHSIGDLGVEEYDSVAAVAFDANGDGHMDLYVLNYVNPCQLFLNSGSNPPSFNLVPAGQSGDLATGNQYEFTYVATTADFDGDGSTE